MNYILAHDVGTSGNKATLYDEKGALAASSTVGYGTSAPKPGYVEQNPDDWWSAVVESTKNLLELAKVKPGDIACVAFSGQTMGSLAVDKDGNPLRPSMIWADMRSSAQAEQLMRAFPAKDFYRTTGHRPSSSYGLPKLMWVRDNEPETFKKTAKTLQAKDYIAFKLTGEFATDYSDALGTNPFDLATRRWSREILDAVNLDPGLFPDAYPSSTIVGRVTRPAAELTGLVEGTPVVVGGGDGTCATAGAGAAREGKAYCVLGSSSWIAFVRNQPIIDDEMNIANWVNIDNVTYSSWASMQAAGVSIEWLKRTMAQSEIRAESEGGENAYAAMNRAALESPWGANNLLFLPYLLGERSPRWDPYARGTFIGLSTKHTKADIYRAVFEGIAFNLKTILASLEAKASANEIVLIGGGAKSQVWKRILADVWERPVVIPAYLEEATSLGAAVAGGVGVGLYPDFLVAETFNPGVERVEPDERSARVYRRLYPLFEESYANLKDLFAKLARAGE